MCKLIRAYVVSRLHKGPFCALHVIYVLFCYSYQPFGLVDENSMDGYLTCKPTETFIGKGFFLVIAETDKM